MRAISQALGADVTWNEKEKTVYITNEKEVMITMYSADGRTLNVYTSQVEAHKAVGWYTEPVVLMYAADGRTQYVEQSQIEANRAVGWYTEPYKKPVVTTPSSPSQYSSGSNTEVTYSGVVYVTPTGKRYHYSASCAGKNARSTSLSAAKSSGKTPCRSCVE